MNCQEFDKHIQAFIERDMDYSRLDEFIAHYRSCEDCHEELEINFLMAYVYQKMTARHRLIFQKNWNVIYRKNLRRRKDFADICSGRHSCSCWRKRWLYCRQSICCCLFYHRKVWVLFMSKKKIVLI